MAKGVGVDDGENERWGRSENGSCAATCQYLRHYMQVRPTFSTSPFFLATDLGGESDAKTASFFTMHTKSRILIQVQVC